MPGIEIADDELNPLVAYLKALGAGLRASTVTPGRTRWGAT